MNMRLTFIGVSVCLILGVAGTLARAEADNGRKICGGLFGENLFAKGGMEEWQNGAPAGWTVEGKCLADEKECAGGKRSARLEATAKGNAKLATDPIPVKPGNYFVRLVFKQSVPEAKEGTYARESYMTVDCLGADGKVLRSAYAFGSELPVSSWSYRHRIVIAPPGTVSLRVSMWFVNHVGEDKPCSLWVDDVEVCPYYPPKVPDAKVTAALAQELGRYTLSVEGGTDYRALEGGLAYAESSSPYAVVDTRSTCGLVRHWTAYEKSTMFWNAAPQRGVSPGVYRISLRLRAGAKDIKDPQRPVIQVTASYPHINAICHGQFFASELKRDGEYHDYSVDFVKPDWTAINIRVDTLQEAPEFWLDYLVVRPLYRFTDADNQALFPALFGVRQPAAGFPRQEKPRVLLLQGLCAEYFDLDRALTLAGTGEVKRISYKITYNEGPVLDGMPGSWEEMYGYDLLIVANTSMQAAGAEGRFMLREWVRNGGGLVILGGKAAYGASSLKGSFLDEALPVEISDNPFDIGPCAAGISLTTHPITSGLGTGAGLACPFIHDLKARPAAQVPLLAGEKPFVALGAFGKGRVACICAPPYGIAPEGKVAFWAWKDWPALVRNVLLWTTGHKENK